MQIKTISRFFLTFALTLSFILFIPKNSKADGSLTIFSESNMTYALTKIARIYSQKYNIDISINFSSSYELIQDIDLGEPADIFISSHENWITELSQKGLVDRYNSSKIAGDNLVLVTSKNNNKINGQNDNLEQIFKEINDKKIPLIVGSNYSSLGRYSKPIIDASKINNFQIFQKINEDKKSIVDFIEEHNEYCGIIMASEMNGSTKIKVLQQIPNIEISYDALVIAGDNMENARKFIAYLKSEEAKKILRKSGFKV